MTALITQSTAAIQAVRELESALLASPQVNVPIEHSLHAGVYARTARIPAGAVVTGAEIKVSTVLVLSGDATVYTGDGEIRLTGYHVIEADAGRKSAFLAHADTALTMLFASRARSVDEAEREFTDEFDALASRR